MKWHSRVGALLSVPVRKNTRHCNYINTLERSQHPNAAQHLLTYVMNPSRVEVADICGRGCTRFAVPSNSSLLKRHPWAKHEFGSLVSIYFSVGEEYEKAACIDVPSCGLRRMQWSRALCELHSEPLQGNFVTLSSLNRKSLRIIKIITYHMSLIQKRAVHHLHHLCDSAQICMSVLVCNNLNFLGTNPSCDL